jgi:hypothetical protein
MGVINPKEYQTRKLFLVHRNIPKRVEYDHWIDGEPGNLAALEGAP